MITLIKAFPNHRSEGMDLRDYFAAKCMQSFMSSFHEDAHWDGHEYADMAYQLADAMMKARGQG